MTRKEEMLKPRVIECVERLRKFIDLDAPGVIIGAEAWHVFTTVLACYGTVSGSTMISHLRDENLQARGICSHEDCVSYVDRSPVGVCDPCCKKLGIDDESLDNIEKSYSEEEDP